MKRVSPFIYSFLWTTVLVFLCTFLTSVIGYRAVGFVLLLGILFIGSLTSLWPTLFAAALSALSWNFFFIPPRFTFVVAAAEDALMFITFFVVATIVGLLTNRIRETEKLRKSEELHQVLLNSISHELRTPLSVLTASATSICDPEVLKDEKSVQSIRSEILNASDRLNRVIENLLDMSRLNSGILSLKLEWNDPQDVIGVAIQKLKVPLKNHKIKVQMPTDLPLVEMDFRLIEHAISNLILNAIQYSPQNSTIFINAEIQNSKLKISIEDEGPGIPEELLGKVFEKFYRIPGSPAGGTGLGLSIVQGIVQAHEGKIRVEKSSHGGANFILEIPYSQIKNMEKMNS